MNALHLNKTVTVKKPSNIPVRCEVTGIITELVGSSLPSNLNLQYLHPLAFQNNARKVAELPLAELSKIEVSVLAGIVLSIYTHFGLIHHHQDAFVSNSILRTAGLPNLLNALTLSVAFSVKNTAHLDNFSLDYDTHSDCVSIGAAFGNYLKIIKVDLYSEVSKSEVDAAIATVTLRKSKNSVNSTVKSDWDKNFDKALIQGRKDAKLALAAVTPALQSAGYEKLANFLRICLPSRNLVAMTSEVRQKVLTRLDEAILKLPEHFLNLAILQEIVTASENPYDIFAKADDVLERASDTFEKPKHKNLLELLAYKKEREALLSAPSALQDALEHAEALEETLEELSEAQEEGEDTEDEEMLGEVDLVTLFARGEDHGE